MKNLNVAHSRIHSLVSLFHYAFQFTESHTPTNALPNTIKH